MRSFNLVIGLVGAMLIMSSCKKEEAKTPQETVRDSLYLNLRLGYHFDDFSSGLVTDFSLNGRDAYPTDLGLLEGVNGSAILFDSHYDRLRTVTGIGEFDKGVTIDFWINYQGDQNADTVYNIVEERAYNNTMFSVRITEDGTPFMNFNHSQDTYEGVISSLRLEMNKWHHVAFTYNGSEVRAYVDGVPVGSNTVLMGVMDSWNSIYFGHSWYATSFRGGLDEFRLTNYVFSEDEIPLLMEVW